MTTKETFVPPYEVIDDCPDKFPVFPPRGDMQNPIYLHRPGHLAALDMHFGSTGTTLVSGEVPVGLTLQQRLGLRVPDLIIAFNVTLDRIIDSRGYSIEEWGKPPDFVMEIASTHTWRNDVNQKRNDYEAFGIPEYWLYDPSGGELYGFPLAGERLVDGAYRPVEIFSADADHHWGHSLMLGLDVCWERGQLRWYDPATQSYLRTYDEETHARIAAESSRDASESARIAAESARIAAESSRDVSESARMAAESARIAAETDRDAALDRVQQLEEELRRLQGS